MAAAPLDDVRDISKLAYGFMASKTLFVALELDVFGHLADGAKTLAELADATGIAASRLYTLLTACVSTGLLSKTGDRYANAPASQDYLVRTAPRYFGDYYRCPRHCTASECNFTTSPRRARRPSISVALSIPARWARPGC
jgi:hypothetical protein